MPSISVSSWLTMRRSTSPFVFSRLGAIESICTCPSVMTHANMLKEDRLKVGITDGLVRLSIGLEDPADLIASLKASLDAL